MAEAAASSGASADAASGGGAAADAGAAANQPWYPETEKDYVTNKGWKAPADVVGSYKSLETLVGADKAGRTIVLPKDDKDVEGIKAFRSKIGVPEAADKYELPAPAGDGGANLVKEASNWFLEAGIPKGAAQAIVQKWNTHMEGLIKAQEAANTAEMNAGLEKLQTEWGNNYDKNTEIAKRAVKIFAESASLSPEEVTQMIGVADAHPAWRKLFASIGQKVMEPGFSSGDANNSLDAGRAQADRKIQELKDKRIANTISQDEYLRQMAILGPQGSGG